MKLADCKWLYTTLSALLLLLVLQVRYGKLYMRAY